MNIILLGPPGSGKGTQSERLEKQFGIKKLSTGDILRKEVSQATEMGLKVKSIMDSGELISDDIMINIILENISHSDCKKGFVLDGFPRTINQAISLEKFLSENNIFIDAVIELAIDTQLLVDRISLRFTCAKCNASYNRKFNDTKINGICDKCGGDEFISRNDDNAEVLKNRLDVYHNQISQLLDHYDQNKLLYKIDGSKNIDEITKEIKLILKI